MHPFHANSLCETDSAAFIESKISSSQTQHLLSSSNWLETAMTPKSVAQSYRCISEAIGDFGHESITAVTFVLAVLSLYAHRRYEITSECISERASDSEWYSHPTAGIDGEIDNVFENEEMIAFASALAELVPFLVVSSFEDSSDGVEGSGGDVTNGYTCLPDIPNSGNNKLLLSGSRSEVVVSALSSGAFVTSTHDIPSLSEDDNVKNQSYKRHRRVRFCGVDGSGVDPPGKDCEYGPTLKAARRLTGLLGAINGLIGLVRRGVGGRVSGCVGGVDDGDGGRGEGAIAVLDQMLITSTTESSADGGGMMDVSDDIIDSLLLLRETLYLFSIPSHCRTITSSIGDFVMSQLNHVEKTTLPHTPLQSFYSSSSSISTTIVTADIIVITELVLSEVTATLTAINELKYLNNSVDYDLTKEVIGFNVEGVGDIVDEKEWGLYLHRSGVRTVLRHRIGWMATAGG